YEDDSYDKLNTAVIEKDRPPRPPPFPSRRSLIVYPGFNRLNPPFSRAVRLRRLANVSSCDLDHNYLFLVHRRTHRGGQLDPVSRVRRQWRNERRSNPGRMG